MTVKDLYMVSLESLIFVIDDGVAFEYYGQDEYSDKKVASIKATDYPNYGNVIEVEMIK